MYERRADRGLLLGCQLRGGIFSGSLAALVFVLGEPAAFLGLRYGYVADVQAVPPLDPCPDLRVGGAFRL